MIAITGFSGFIGKHLMHALEGEKLLLLGRKNIETGNKFSYLDFANINQSFFLRELESVQTIVHLAAVNSDAETANDSLDTSFKQINTDATITLAKQAAKAGVKRFILLSTIKVLGESSDQTGDFSNAMDLSPQSTYAKSKAEAELGLKQVADSSGMEYVIIRPPLVYGHNVQANFRSLVKMTNKWVPLPLRSIKHNKRSFIYVYNLIDIIRNCIEKEEAANQTFLVSDDQDLSTSVLIAMLYKMNGKPNLALPIPKSVLHFLAKTVNKTQQLQPLISSLRLDISHTKKTLNWRPPHTAEYGLEMTCKSETEERKA